MSPSALRSRKWRRVTHGFYTPPLEGRLSTAQRILDVTPLLATDGVIGGWAAAYVLGVDWLDGLDPYTMRPVPVDVLSNRIKRRNPDAVQYRYAEFGELDVKVCSGVPVTTRVRTAFDGARWAPSLEEAVAFLDAMDRFDQLPIERLHPYIGDRRGLLGIRQAAAASELTEFGVRSPWESRLRMCYRLQALLPAPMVNTPIFSPSGELLGIADLFDPEAGFVAEFDGSQHRERDQHRSDNLREEKFESANLTVVRFDSVDLRRSRRAVVDRLRDGYRRGMRRDRRYDRLVLEAPEWFTENERVDR